MEKSNTFESNVITNETLKVKELEKAYNKLADSNSRVNIYYLTYDSKGKQVNLAINGTNYLEIAKHESGLYILEFLTATKIVVGQISVEDISSLRFDELGSRHNVGILKLTLL